MDSLSKVVFAQNDLPTPEPDSPAVGRARRPYGFSTLCATVENPDESHKDQHGSSSVPIYQSATFKGVGNAYDYSRSGNPTRTHLGECRHVWDVSPEALLVLATGHLCLISGLGALGLARKLGTTTYSPIDLASVPYLDFEIGYILFVRVVRVAPVIDAYFLLSEHHIAKISSAAHAFVVSSGMAALDVITRILKPGCEVIAGDDLYGGTNRLLTYLRTHMGVTVHHVDTTEATSVLPYLNPGKTAMVLLESPTNPLLKVVDIARISALVKEKCEDAVIVVDNTMMSPYLQRPLEHGADIVYDSATKYLSGHHDLMAGVIVCNRDDLAKQMAFTINAVGNALTPFDSFLLLRGIKTLAIRMDRQQSSAMLVAQLLSRLGFVTHYPGLPNHPNKEVHERIADGYGAVLSFETGDKGLSERIVGATRLWGISVSFGCVNSLISMPCVMSHASIDPATRAARGLPEDLIRLCVGIEDPADLLDDLQHALLEAGAITIAANDFVRIPNAVNKAVEKLALHEPLRNEPVVEVDQEWLISAPGKVILFGEHAVVHGVTAIAASVGLRCYGLASPRNDSKISVHLLNIGDFYHEWDIDDLPWDVVTSVPPGSAHPDTLDQRLVDAIVQRALPPPEQLPPKSHGAALAFLYLFMALAYGPAKDRPSFSYTTRSTLPVGAGLGSSAAYSACIATAILLATKRISIPSVPELTRLPTSDGDPGHIHVSHQGRKAIPPDVADEVNNWAFVSEKVLHGNPSGVDNAVSIFGGALAYTRAGFGKKSGMDPIYGFKSLRFLLVDSQVARDTKALVAGVAAKKAAEPVLVEGLLNAIQSISDEARRLLADPELSREATLSALAALIDENHAHLISLGVSHESLEKIRRTTAAQPYQLSTKLTGAGGGGCAVTLVPDGFHQTTLQSLMYTLEGEGFQPYLTAVGGSGLGVLPPHRRHLNQTTASAVDARITRPVTPPDTPAGNSDIENVSTKALKADFAAVEKLTEWAEGKGKWLFV